MKTIIFGLAISLAVVGQANAATKLTYKNFYFQDDAQKEFVSALKQMNVREEMLSFLSFKYSVATAREAGSGMASGRRQHAPIIFNNGVEKRYKAAIDQIKKDNYVFTSEAEKKFKKFLKKLRWHKGPVVMSLVLENVIRDLSETIVPVEQSEEFFQIMEGVTQRFISLHRRNVRTKEILELLRVCQTQERSCSQNYSSQLSAEKQQLDSMSDLSELEMMRLQAFMEQRSKLIETLSNIIKKMSETSSSITQNMK